LFHEPIRLNYSETELAGSVEEIKNDIARACLQFLEYDGPIYISTIADVPSASGLGSSSSFAVGLLNALHALRGEQVSAGQLACEACHIEIELLQSPIGKQDQFAAAYGGLNYIVFHDDDNVSVAPVRLHPDKLKELFSHILLFWTGLSRSAASVLNEQKANFSKPANMEYMTAIRKHADVLYGHLSTTFDPHAVGRLLDESWQCKRRLASKISSDHIDEWYERGKAAGAIGGKLCGAGGGGFLMLIVEAEKQEAVCCALSDLACVRVSCDTCGSRLLFPHQ
jgi:D-glycero-alpha-D-manno-heptose-7-phosphate kinase